MVVTKDFEALKAEFEQGGCASGGIEAEGDRDDGGFGDRYLDYGWVRSASWAKATHCVAFGVETEMVICGGGGGGLRGVESRV